MTNYEADCRLYTQNHSTINGFGVWHYLIETPIGYIHVVEYEKPDKELKRYIIDGDYEAAERKYNYICRAIINGTLFRT